MQLLCLRMTSSPLIPAFADGDLEVRTPMDYGHLRRFTMANPQVCTGLVGGGGYR